MVGTNLWSECTLIVSLLKLLHVMQHGRVYCCWFVFNTDKDKLGVKKVVVPLLTEPPYVLPLTQKEIKYNLLSSLKGEGGKVADSGEEKKLLQVSLIYW